LLNNIRDEERAEFDREDNRHTAYSVRNTYVCLRLMEGADIYQIAKNCRANTGGNPTSSTQMRAWRNW
jgi:hypothetical protein